MKTSCFFTFKGPGRISIARYAPRGTPAGFRVFKGLSPGSWFNSVTEAQYRELFAREILGRLDPVKVWDDLHTLAGGNEPVLLCWEQTRDLQTGKTYCHRRIVADWFERELGYKVEELEFGVREGPLRLVPER